MSAHLAIYGPPFPLLYEKCTWKIMQSSVELPIAVRMVLRLPYMSKKDLTTNDSKSRTLTLWILSGAV